jgi:hypothetical protein
MKCEKCQTLAEFGYRDKATDTMRWFCTDHRLGKHYADARVGSPMAQWETKRD